MKKITILCLISFLPFSFNNAIYSNSLYFDESPNNKFIDRWEFEKLSNFIFDPATEDTQIPSSKQGMTFDPNLVKPGDIIFVREAGHFFRSLGKRIKVPYIIITHGHHLDSFQPEYKRFLEDNKIIAWFSIDPYYLSLPKFYPLPLGVWQSKSQKIYTRKSHFNKLFSKLRYKHKNKLIYTNFSFKTYEKRDLVKDILKKKHLYKQTYRKNFEDYIIEMSNYKFTASPRGAGIDCYRTWEALLVGSIPIVLSSSLDPLYEDLPVLIIQDWNQLNKNFLKKKYLEITKKKYSLRKLYIDYWQRKIKDVQKSYLENRSVF